MDGNILFVDYDLSSWQHYEDDEVELPYTQMEKYLLGLEKPSPESNIVVKYNDNPFFTIKGNGSAYGGQWRPNPDKPWEERFFGKPGEIKETFIPTQKGGYWVKTKIGKNGKAEYERQFTDHGNSATHSNPHDNLIGWNNERGNPEWIGEKNYFDGNIPEFKYYKITGRKTMDIEYNFDYKTKYEFIESVKAHSEIVFEWNNKEYEIFSYDGKTWLFVEIGSNESPIKFYQSEDLINFKIDENKLIDICTKFTVIERSL